MSSSAVVVISLFGAACQSTATLRWYEPPPRDDGTASGDADAPVPVLEAAIFFVVFAVLFSVVGSLISTAGGLVPPYSRFATLLLTPLGWGSAYALATGRLAADRDTAVRAMGAVAGLVVGVYPLALLAA